MKKIFVLFVLMIAALRLLSQSQGISYQAILINEDEQEIPGVDVAGNYLPAQNLSIRFTIFDENNAIDYQEVHETQTDQYGMINVTIGWGVTTGNSPGTFMDIDWNGTPKKLGVDINLEGSLDGFIEFSLEELSFVPYAYHRNITATGTMIIEDVTDLNSDLNVNNGSQTYLSGNLAVDLETDLNGNLNVNNGSATNLSGTLSVEEETNLNSDLHINNGSSTSLSGDLTVQGESTLQRLNITTLNSESAEDEFVATFINTNAGDGDGIKIKLGKKATKNLASAQTADAALQIWLGNVNLTDPEYQFIPKILDGDLDTDDMAKLLKFAVPTVDDAQAVAATVIDLTEMIGTELVHFLNDKLGLPYSFPSVSINLPLGIGNVDVINGFVLLPKIPDVDLHLDFLGQGFNLPSVKVSDVYVNNPLHSENVFVEFTDNEDFTMGAIQAQSIKDWSIQFLDVVFLYELYSTFKGIDKAEIMPELNSLGKEIAKSYLEIGVSYTSGNGDYAEWLERLDTNEVIGAGDIVGVRGGKISKDLTNAEQVMAISYNPIVLGNTPKVGKEYLGNNVAFMGQIPVKIMGAVHSGDFIVGKGDIPGYGVAISQEDMTLEDFKFAVGRSWVENKSSGPKMVNTVVGLHNGDYLHILKGYEDRFKKSETRIKNLEDKLELLINKN